ncbi:hypothetical protein [Enterobacter bugandensis]|uniref:hypothetical protein n=1 Tax=Enterobacter bugandensis TaxID=881260 RepID=UPI0010421A31|nr:hypothetical protein [Enterobacter bugandensis]
MTYSFILTSGSDVGRGAGVDFAGGLGGISETAEHGRRPSRDTAVVNRASKLSLPSGRPS